VTAIYDPRLQPLDIGLEHTEPVQERIRRRFTGRLFPWFARHTLDLTVIAAITVIAAVVHAWGMYYSPARFDDEGTYTAYAWAVEYLRRLSHYTYWYAHPPLGWMQIAGWTSITDGFDRAPYAVAAGREFMLVCKVISVPLVYAIGRRMRLGRFGCVVAVAVFALSPLSVYFTRGALLDNIVTPWLLASFFFAASPRRSIAAAVASSMCFSVAVLTKETALLYLPAVVLMLWQFADRRNRRFTTGLFAALFILICTAYPIYALVKNELFVGPGHVSLEWAVRWQLFERTGSGSIFDPSSTASAVIRSWIDLDPWLPAIALATVAPGLLLPRTRAVAFALALQVMQLLRNGYLPYPYVIAMIPFAALTIGGVADAAVRIGVRRGSDVPALGWRGLIEPWRLLVRHLSIRLRSVRAARMPASTPTPTPTPVPVPREESDRGDAVASDSVAQDSDRGDAVAQDAVAQDAVGIEALAAAFAAPSVPEPVRRPRPLTRRDVLIMVRVVTASVIAAVTLQVGQAWAAPLSDLRSVNRDAGKAAALQWIRDNVPRWSYLVVDDSLWVDLVRSGFPADHVIWFTKLDVDAEVRIPSSPQWAGIDYVVIDEQDELSLHLQSDGLPSRDTLDLFPTIGKALQHAAVVQRFGDGLDSISVRQVDPARGTGQGASTGPMAGQKSGAKTGAKPTGTGGQPPPPGKGKPGKPARKPAKKPARTKRATTSSASPRTLPGGLPGVILLPGGRTAPDPVGAGVSATP
jgi:Dolichyl-phosphate-mannose-protein mannosyltransferase